MSRAPNPVCPECRASLDVDILGDTTGGKCPFCGTPFTGHMAAIAVIPHDPRALVTSDRHDDFRNPPPGSAIRVVDSTDERLVLYLPAGRSLGGVGCFAIGFAIFLFAILVLLIEEGIRGKLEFHWDVVTLIKAVKPLMFLLGGLLFIGIALRSRFERTLLFVDRRQAVVQRMLFGKKTKTAVDLCATSGANLEEAQSFKDLAVFQVIITGQGAKLEFGGGLTQTEKEWLADCINGFFSRVDTLARLDDNGSPSEDSVGSRGPHKRRTSRTVGTSLVIPLAPEQLPATTLVQVVTNTDQQLRLTFRSVASRWTRWLLPAAMLPPSLIFDLFSLFLLVAAIQKAGDPKAFFAGLGALAAMLVGMPPTLLSLYLLFGRNTIILDRDKLRCRWHVGPFGISRALATASVEDVTFDYGIAAPRNPGQARPEPIPFSIHGRTCVARGAGRRVFLTLFQPADVARQVAGLLVERLREWGFLPTSNCQRYSSP